LPNSNNCRQYPWVAVFVAGATPGHSFREQILVAQHALVYAAKAAYFPRISLTGLLGFQSTQLSNLFTGPSGIWSFVTAVDQPIFTAGRLKSNVKFARAQQELALVQLPTGDSNSVP